jgi:hypothetical protein
MGVGKKLGCERIIATIQTLIDVQRLAEQEKED